MTATTIGTTPQCRPAVGEIWSSSGTLSGYGTGFWLWIRVSTSFDSWTKRCRGVYQRLIGYMQAMNATLVGHQGAVFGSTWP